jgi:hypothetical protein
VAGKITRIDRRLATAKDVETVWNTDPIAADVLRADAVRVDHAVRIIRAARIVLYDPEHGVSVKRAKLRFEEMRAKEPEQTTGDVEQRAAARMCA